jgi:predicted membrane chloride channel (bestrophin family)
VNQLGWLTVPVVAAACWCLFGIEEIGHLIEQPFMGFREANRPSATYDYDMGLPVCAFANDIRAEVENIAATDYMSSNNDKIETGDSLAITLK